MSELESKGSPNSTVFFHERRTTKNPILPCYWISIWKFSYINHFFNLNRGTASTRALYHLRSFIGCVLKDLFSNDLLPPFETAKDYLQICEHLKPFLVQDEEFWY